MSCHTKRKSYHHSWTPLSLTQRYKDFLLLARVRGDQRVTRTTKMYHLRITITVPLIFFPPFFPPAVMCIRAKPFVPFSGEPSPLKEKALATLVVKLTQNEIMMIPTTNKKLWRGNLERQWGRKKRSNEKQRMGGTKEKNAATCETREHAKRRLIGHTSDLSLLPPAYKRSTSSNGG